MGYNNAMNTLSKFPIGEKVKNSAEFKQSYEEGQYVMHEMRQRLILLWNACTKYKYLRILHPKQKKALELWEHMQDCCDKKCKRKYCRSSRLMLAHFQHCKRSNKCLSCKLCAPVAICIAQDSNSTCKITNKQHGPIRKRKQMDQDLMYKAHKKKTSVSDKSVKGGGKEYSLLKFILTNQVKDYPLRLRQTKQHLNNQTLDLDKATNIWDPNRVIALETKPATLIDSGITFADNIITEEDGQAIIEASIILSRLKKRRCSEIVPDATVSAY